MTAPVSPRKYRIERYIAEGGMGAIYVGKKIGASGFEREVVLKQLLPEFTARPEFRDLFFREAKISGTLDHVNIVRTFDLVKSDDSLFIVMEYVRGADLRTIAWRARMRRQALSAAAVIHVTLEILAGLAYAHSRTAEGGQALGIIHRDVSPSNILCSGQGDVKLSDFGIAKATTFSSVFYRVRGKVGYMSPEQARNAPLDARSDLFSLAVCLFETLTGERLYAGDLQTPPDVIYAQGVPRLSLKRPDLPADLDPVMERALALDVDARYQDARGFSDALREVARRHGMLYSAPQLAAELAQILGPDADGWLSEETVSHETDRIALAGAAKGLEGREADSIVLGDGRAESAPHLRPRGPLTRDESPRPLSAPVPPESPAVLPRAPLAPLVLLPVPPPSPRPHWVYVVGALALLSATAAGITFAQWLFR